MTTNDSEKLRRQVVDQSKRIVIKVGSRLLTDEANGDMAGRIGKLVAEIAWLRSQQREIILVSSGAIAAGMVLTGEDKRPKDLPRLQALAAIGQSRLMSLYESACQEHGFHCAQILLSADDVQDRQRHLNVRNCLNSLPARGTWPIINENDAVCIDEIRFGDNDSLAALVAAMNWAELTVFLTTINGMRRREGGKLGERIGVITNLDREIRDMARDTDDKSMGTGGMKSKIQAAEIIMTAGESLWIANGLDFGVLREILAGNDVGTLFVPGSTRLTGAKRWLAFFTEPAGRIVVDTGAAAALRRRGKSLLPSGISEVEGEFRKGDSVVVSDPDGEDVAMGISNYTADELRRIKGEQSSRIRDLLGKHDYDEAIHRDNMVVWPAGASS